MTQSEASILDAFEKNELDISELYKIYSEKILEHSDFWRRLSNEEIGHAKEISSLNNNASEEQFQENKFSRGVINYISSFVSEQIEYAKNNVISHSDAINIALRVEQSMLEKKCFEMFSPTGATLREVLTRLNKDTNKHEMMLREELKKQAKG